MVRQTKKNVVLVQENLFRIHNKEQLNNSEKK